MVECLRVPEATYRPAIYMLILGSTPRMIGCTFYYYTNELKMTEAEMAIYNNMGQITNTLGIMMFATPVLSKVYRTCSAGLHHLRGDRLVAGVNVWL